MAIHKSINVSFDSELNAKTATKANIGHKPIQFGNPAAESVIVRLGSQKDSLQIGLRAKLILPYIILVLIVSITATYVVTNVVLGSWTERFNNQLFSAADEVADMLVGFETNQLATWRQIAFTQGVAEAAGASNLNELETLLLPLFLNNAPDQILVLDNAGNSLYVLADDHEAKTPSSETAVWPITTQLLAEPSTRHVGLQIVDGETFLYTGGVLTAVTGENTGLLLVGTSLSNLAAQLEESALAGITLYSLDGQILVSTVGQTDPDALVLSPDLASQVLAEQASQTSIRTITPAKDEYAQALIPFELGQGMDVGLIGVSLRTQLLASPLYPARNAVIMGFVTAVAAIMIMGYSVAGTIIRPVEELITASQQVADGDLTVQVQNNGKDEIGVLASSFNSMVTQLRQRRTIEDLFGRYVGDNIAQRLLSGEAELGGQTVQATILFSDIRDFTAFTEKANLSELFDELNEYYAMMQQVIDAHGGVVNKFGGDSILAIFGAPLPLPNHAQSAVQAAVDMMDQLALLNGRRQARGCAPFRIGIGVNSGEIMAGNLGSERRREYTVLGDTVNAAKRLSDLNKETPIHSIFISENTRSALNRAHTWQMENLGDTFVKGKAEAVPVFAVMHK